MIKTPSCTALALSRRPRSSVARQLYHRRIVGSYGTDTGAYKHLTQIRLDLSEENVSDVDLHLGERERESESLISMSCAVAMLVSVRSTALRFNSRSVEKFFFTLLFSDWFIETTSRIRSEIGPQIAFMCTV